MINKLCLLLANKICPITQQRNPGVREKAFARPERRWEDTEGVYVEYSRSRGVITWATNAYYEEYAKEFKMDQQPPMELLIDWGAELLECYQSKDPILSLAKYAISEMPDEVFLWIYEMAHGSREIFTQFMDFYLNEVHEGFQGMTGSKAFAVQQMDKLRALLEEQDLCEDVQEIAGTQMCVHAARYALRLDDKMRPLIMQKLMDREEIPGLPFEMSDDTLARFMRAVRVVLLKQ